MQRIIAAAAIIGLGFAAAGCTSAPMTPAAPAPASTTAVSTPTPSMSESAAGKDIVDTAVAAATSAPSRRH